MGNLDFSANADQLKELAAYMASQINVPTIGIGGGYAPIGAIQFFDATTAPQDWLACDGTVYNIADYPQLADWYEAQHGSKNFYGGDGTTTFAVPDLQGEFLRGTGTNSHTNQGSGANIGVHQDGTTVMNLYTRGSDGRLYIFLDNSSNYASVNYDKVLKQSTNNVSFAASKANDVQDFIGTVRPTNTSFLICVKAVVAGEVYSTEERVVGTWIDGKKLYQRVIHGTTSSKSMINMTDIVSGGIPNADNARIIECYVTYTISNGTWNGPIPNSFDASALGSINIKKDASVLYFGILFADYNNKPFTAIIQYTKTTD